MTMLFARLPEIAKDETRSVAVPEDDDVPSGRYDFIEFFCDELDCDCRRALIQVRSPAFPNQVLATINYGWEPREFYVKWMGDEEMADEMVGICLYTMSAQSRYAPALLQLFRDVVAMDPQYALRIQRHYAQFKESLPAENT